MRHSLADATLADAGEFGLIAALADLFAQGEHVLVGPGDDAAVLRVTHRPRGGLDRPDGRGPALPPRLGLAPTTSATGPPRRTSPTSTRWAAAPPR